MPNDDKVQWFTPREDAKPADGEAPEAYPSDILEGPAMPPSQQEQVADALIFRQGLANNGDQEGLDSLEFHQDPKATADSKMIMDQPESPSNWMDIGAQMFVAEAESLAAVDQRQLEFDLAEAKQWDKRVPEGANNGFRWIRTEYRHLRREFAINLTRNSLRIHSMGNAIRDASITALEKGAENLGVALDKDGVVWGMAMSDPALRSQQVAFGISTGEGISAFSRFHPEYILSDGQIGDDGRPEEETPWSAALQASAADNRGDAEGTKEAMIRVRDVQDQHQENLIWAMDLPDKWFGKERMDQMYVELSNQGIVGKFRMAKLSAAYMMIDMFGDPQLGLSSLPAKLIRAGRGLATTMSLAARWGSKFQKTGTILDGFKAAESAAAHVDHIEKMLTKSVEAGKGVDPKIYRNLQKARRMLAEADDNYSHMLRTEADMISEPTPQRRDYNSVTTRVEETEGSIVAAQNRKFDTAEGPMTWRIGMDDDMRRGLYIANEHVLNPKDALLTNYAKKYQFRGIGRNHPSVRGKHTKALQILDGVAERLGIRIVPFNSTAIKGSTSNLGGAYIPSSRTMYINVNRPLSHDLVSVFYHEGWHHTANRILSAAENQHIVKGLQDAGFDVSRFKEKLGKTYSGLHTTTEVVEEATARATSEMMAEPSFWETMYRLDPKLADDFATDAADLAMMSRQSIDNIGGRRPSQNFKFDMPGDEARIKMEEAWIKHSGRVMKALEKAYKTQDVANNGTYRRVITEVRDITERMSDDIVKMESLGYKAEAKAAKAELDNAEKYLGRLESGKFSEMLLVHEYKRKWLYTLEPDEIKDVLIQQRREALATPTTDLQPRQFVDDVVPEREVDELFDHKAMGPDDAEVAAENLGLAVHGASPADDLTIHLNLIPERGARTGGRIVPGTVKSMLDTDLLEYNLRQAKTRARIRQQELGDYDPWLAMVDQAYAKRKAKFGSGEMPWDDRWLPQPRKTAAELAKDGWTQDYKANFFDRMQDGLYPGSWRLPIPGAVKVAWGNFREPMRMMEAADPGSWKIYRGAMYDTENETVRMMSVFTGALEDFGAVVVEKPSGLKKLFMSGAQEKVKTNMEASDHIFRLLEMDTSSKEYIEAMALLTEKQRNSIVTIRKELRLTGGKLVLDPRGDKFMENYMPHVFDQDLYRNGGQPPNMAGMTRSGNLFMAHLLDRNGAKGYNTDAVAALEVYARSASRKIHMEPGLKRIKLRAEYLAKDPRNPYGSMYVKYVDDMIREQKGESSLAGESVDRFFSSIAERTGRKYAPGAMGRNLMSISGLVYSSLLAGNRRYPVMAIATSIVTTGAQYGIYRTLKGMMKMGTPEGQLVFDSMGGRKTWGKIFETESPGGIKWINSMTDKVTNIHLGSPSVQSTENFIRGMTFWAAIDLHCNEMGFKSIRQAARSGALEEIMFDSLIRTEQTNHFFGKGSKPPSFSKASRSGAVASTQFLSFTPKQTEQLLAMAGDNPGHLASFFMLSGWLQRVGTQELGINLEEYLGYESIKLDSRNTVSPIIQTVRDMITYQDELSALLDGHGNAEATTRAGDQLMRDLEIAMPLLARAREAAAGASITATGEKWSPNSGVTRDVDLKYMNPSDMGIGLPDVNVPFLGDKGDRGEAMAMYLGVKSQVEHEHQEARKESNRQIQMAAAENLSLVEKAQHAARTGDWDAFNNKVKDMADAGWPIGDLSKTAANQISVDTLGWYIVLLRRNPGLRHKIIPILMEHGIIKSGEEYTGAEDQ